MAQQRHLAHAPITEAVIDLRCQVDSKFDLNKLRDLKTSVGYGEPKEITRVDFELRQDPGGTAQSREIDHGIIGWRFNSNDGKQVLQFRQDGCTFSRLAPYTKWDDVFAEACRFFKLFVKIANPQEVNRIAVRYINRMLFPLVEIKDFSPFLTAPPACPNVHNVSLASFFNQIQLKENNSSVAATIIQTVQPPSSTETDKVPVILDIDVFEVGNFSPDPDVFLSHFTSLRDAKNRYFFSSITDNAAILFE